jgi:SET domain-containing protein
MEVTIPQKILVKSSPIHGFGVFAKENISKGEIIEECYAIFFKLNLGVHDDIFPKYRFLYPCGSNPTHNAIPLGYGCIYNHSETPNAYWTCNSDNAMYYFISLRDIEKGEEIFTSYGDIRYWDNVKKYI